MATRPIPEAAGASDEEEYEEEIEVEEEIVEETEEEETEYETEGEEEEEGEEPPAGVGAKEEFGEPAPPPPPAAADNPLPPAAVPNLRALLSPFGKDQLMDLLTSAALSNSALLKRLVDAANADPAHRKLFVYNLPPAASSESLAVAFSPFGPITEARAVIDKASGRCKGYGFVVFDNRASAVRAVSANRKIFVSGREVSVQFASIRSPGNASSGPAPDATGRKIFVSGLPASASAARLRAFFEKFGEIEDGPLGGDRATGALRGFAFIVFKTADGLKKALEEPKKWFDGFEITCQRALDGMKNKPMMERSVPSDSSMLAPVVPPNNLPLASASQALLGLSALLGQGLNPAALGLLAHTANVNVGAVPGFFNPANVGVTSTSGSGLSHATPQMAYGSGLGLNTVNPSAMGAYGQQATFQGIAPYQNNQGARPYGGNLSKGPGLPDYYGR